MEVIGIDFHRGPGMFTEYIFKVADSCVESGCFPGLEDQRYALLLIFGVDSRAEIHRADVNCALPAPCRVWIVKGRLRYLLGDSASLPGDVPCAVRPPYVG